MDSFISKIRIPRAGRFLAAGIVLICLMAALFVPAVYAAGTEPSPTQGTVTLPVSQIFTNNDPLASPDGIFTYRLKPETASAPMPAGSNEDGYTFTITGTDQVNIGPITFSTPGIYSYKLSGVTDAKTGYAMDTQVYTVKIYVTNDFKTISEVCLCDGDKTPKAAYQQVYGTPVPSGATLLFGFKTWDYGNAPANDRPDSITVLIKNGNKTVKKITVTAADGWKWSAQLPKNDANGNPINYTVNEANVPHYTHTVDGYNLTNTYVSPGYPGDSPNTGDDGNLYLWIALICAGFASLTGLVIIGKTSKRRSALRTNL